MKNKPIPKIEVTDEMVRIALKILWISEWASIEENKQRVRIALEAVFNHADFQDGIQKNGVTNK